MVFSLALFQCETNDESEINVDLIAGMIAKDKLFDNLIIEASNHEIALIGGNAFPDARSVNKEHISEYMSALKVQFEEVKSINEFENIARRNFVNADDFIESTYLITNTIELLYQKYPEFQKAGESVRVEIFELALNKHEVANSKIKDNDITLSELARVASTQGESGCPGCDASLENSLNTCAYSSYAAAAACGLLTPTLVGALACGAGVIVADAICHNSAHNEHGICVQYDCN